MNKFARFSLVSLTTLGTGAAMAAVPAEVTAALSTIQADALTVAGVVLVAVIAIFAFKFLRKGL